MPISFGKELNANSSLEERRLVRRAKEGSLAAFRLLVEQNKDLLLSLACSILKDQELAEDVLQDALIKVFRKLPGFKESASFRTWLYRIVINTSYNALKKQESYRKLKASAQDSYSPTENHHQLTKEEQKKYVHLALSQLKADEALVLRLYYLCEMSLAEISDSTGFRKAKIKTDLYRGRINCAKQLQFLLGNETKELL